MNQTVQKGKPVSYKMLAQFLIGPLHLYTWCNFLPYFFYQLTATDHMRNKLYMPKSGFYTWMFHIRMMVIHLVYNGIGERRMFVCYRHTKAGPRKIEHIITHLRPTTLHHGR